MVTASPPVSPSVVARILMIQKRRVTCGTFATNSDLEWLVFVSIGNCFSLGHNFHQLVSFACNLIYRQNVAHSGSKELVLESVGFQGRSLGRLQAVIERA